MRRLNSFGFWLWFPLLLLGILTWGAATAQGQAKEPEKPAAPDRLKDLDNPKGEIKVELTVDREDATYKVGDQIVFTFRTNKDCRLTLFNVGTSGKVHVLFPNEHHKDNLVKAGTVYRIPPEGAKFVFKAQGPAGEDVVKAIATLENVPLVNEANLKPAGPFQEVGKPEKDIVIGIQSALKPVDFKKWAEAEKVIKIVE
ncbi:MAG: DUF4384 domain-containing protein [Deltaproteobacteria bacterium]|nr:DUF4384 domain-containing protein [Deltaproteobacteria bacterium]MBM4284626.1 DUF4384 domain-containing protein [Deltaproteobacteria bacterium]